MNISPRVLIVDDDQFVRTVLREMLSPSGYQCFEARDGIEAMERVRADRPHVILLDLLMPKMSGIQALQEIGQTSPRSRVVVITSLASDALLEQALSAGACGYVVKPFHPMEIQEAVRQALRAEA
jgi:two-component system, chemotaxis family, chemotaxis protein CheY